MRNGVLPGLAPFLLPLATAACEPPRPPAVPAPAAATEGEEDVAFLRSEKLDEDVQELVVRAFGADVVFTFDVSARAPLDAITRARFRERGVSIEGGDEADRSRLYRVEAKASALGVLTGDERVRAVRCAPPPLPNGPLPDEDAWRKKLERDVRTIVGAKSTCWFEVTIRFGKEPPAGERAYFEEHGVVVLGWSADDAIAWVPVGFLPWVALRSSVAFVEVRRNFR